MTRKVDLDLKTAKNLYLRGGEAKKFALSVYKEYELNDKVFEDSEILDCEKELEKYCGLGSVFYFSNNMRFLNFYIIAKKPTVIKNGNNLKITIYYYNYYEFDFIKGKITPLGGDNCDEKQKHMSNHSFLYRKHLDPKDQIFPFAKRIEFNDLENIISKQGEKFLNKLKSETNKYKHYYKKSEETENTVSNNLKNIENLSVVSDLKEKLNL